jgi:N-acetylglutamate synthase-like GNAT family acetyltransferase
VTIEQAKESDFEDIKKYIAAFDLDNRDLQYQQFLVAKENGKLIGFGRIRKHKGCDEFCSLGVLEEKRFNGIAKELILARINIATQPIYLVCIMPEYFEKLGFVKVTEYPAEMADKLQYCTAELVVPEEYVVMKYQKNEAGNF